MLFDMKTDHKKELLEIVRIAAKDEKLLDALLQDLLTPEEYRDISNRWQIVKRLAKGENQRFIMRDLKVAFATITRGSRTLENEGGGFNQLLQKITSRR
jgi:Trp operon repressor